MKGRKELDAEDRHNAKLYARAYSDPKYRMGEARFTRALALMRETMTESLLDVGCGRGELLDALRDSVRGRLYGVDIVPGLARVDDRVTVISGPSDALGFLDGDFELVTCFDVLEHLSPRKAEATVREMGRVAWRRLILSISNIASQYPKLGELHVNRRPYEEWDRLLRTWLPNYRVLWRTDTGDRGCQFWEAARIS